MGEIAEALKRSREEREAREAASAAERAASPASDAPPGRSELLAALQEAARPPARSTAAATPSPDSASATSATAAPASPAPAPAPSMELEPAEPAAEPLHELSAESLASFGSVDMHRHLALQVAAQLEHRDTRCIAVLSALRDEGKTTVACTLAVALASVTALRSVALVDLDLRNPSVGRRLGLPRQPGVEEYLQGRADLDAIRVGIATPQLDVFPSVEPHRAAHELLAGARVGNLIRALEKRYEAVIIDTPPTLVVPDASLLLKHGPCAVLVARSGVTRVSRFQEMLDLLPEEVIVGKVLNSAVLPSRDKSYYEYSYGVDAEVDAEEDAKDR